MTVHIDWKMLAGYAAVGYAAGTTALPGQRHAGLKGAVAAVVLAQLAPRIPLLQARLRPPLLLEDGSAVAGELGAFWNRNKDPNQPSWLSQQRDKVKYTAQAYRLRAQERREQRYENRMDRRFERKYRRHERRADAARTGTGAWRAVNRKSGWTAGQRVRSNADAVRALQRIFRGANLTSLSDAVASRSGWRTKNAGGVLSWGLAQVGHRNARARAQIVNLRNEWEAWNAGRKGARQRRTAGVLNQLASILTGATHAYADRQAGQYMDTGITENEALTDPGAPADEGTPTWVKPVAIGAGVLLLGGGLFLALRR